MAVSTPAAPCTRVFLHGFASTRASWDAVLQATGQALGDASPEDGAPLPLCLPLPGHEAPLPPPPATFVGAAQQLLAQLPAGPIHLIGYSLGARLALAMALAAPERLHCLTLIGVQPGLKTDAERALRRAQDGTWQRRLRNEGLAAFVRAWQAQPLFASQRLLPAAVLQAQQRQRLSLDAQALAAALDWVGLAAMPNFWGRLRALTLPCALVAGAQDRKFCRLLAPMAELLPHATVHVVEQAGHNVPLERPQAIAALLCAHEAMALAAPSP